MEHEGRCVGNHVNAYTSDMDFHGGSKLSKLTYPIKTIYSKEARVQLRKVLDDFKPDVCHLAFCVDSVERTVNELAEVGIECEPIRVDDYTGKKMTFFHDPDGLPLELHE